MIYLPDTNAVSRYLRGKDASLGTRMKAAFAELRLSAVVVAELEYGACKRAELPALRTRLEQLVALVPVLSFDRADAAFYGLIRARLETLKPNAQPVGSNDLMIAAQALRRGATVVTHNVREFSRVPGLSLEDWQTHDA